jgi:hypothetical protein
MCPAYSNLHPKLSLWRDPRNPDGFFLEFLTIETNTGKNTGKKTAKALGLTVPRSLFTHATRFIV